MATPVILLRSMSRHGIVNTINQLQSLPEWDETAVFIAWDDSDGWYDHVIGPIMNQSCQQRGRAHRSQEPAAPALNSLAGIQARCGYGPRLPLVRDFALRARKLRGWHACWIRARSCASSKTTGDLGRIGDGSFDAIAGSVNTMFDFNNKRHDRLFLDTTTGQIAAIQH